MSPRRAVDNLAGLIARHAHAMPDKLALVVPTRWDDTRVQSSEEITFGQLWARIQAYRRGLRRAGFAAGDRVVLMFPVSVELYALALALLAEGIVAVLIDAGMGAAKMAQAIRDSRAKALVSVEALLRLRPLLPPLHPLRCYSADGGPRLWARPLQVLRRDQGPDPGAPRPVAPGDHGLITFTSGSTGRPKGADRTHGHLRAQHEVLAQHFPEHTTEIDCPCFPVVTLHNLCCGITTVIPAVDLSAPGSVTPAVVLEQIRRRGITRLAGAPTFLSRIVEHMLAHQERAPSVRALFVGGAPVTLELCDQIAQALPQADAKVVYGSTEAEPMTSIRVGERLQSQADGQGTLVGYPSPEATLRLVDLPEGEDLHELDWRGLDPYGVGPGQVGEVVVRGVHVNQAYVDNPEATRANKLIEIDGAVWHRTGDMGRWDDQGRLWLVGRLGDVVRHEGRPHHPFGAEERCERVRGVARAALLAHPYTDRAVLVWSPEPGAGQDPDPTTHRVRGALDELGLRGAQLARVPRMPVDRRHQTKIDRGTLRAYLSARAALSGR